MLTPKALKPLLLLVVALYGSFLLLVYVDGLQYVRGTSSQAPTQTQIPTTLPLGIRLQHSRAPPLRIEQMDPPLYLQAEGILINYFIILLFFIALLRYCFIIFLLFSDYFFIISFLFYYCFIIIQMVPSFYANFCTYILQVFAYLFY